MSLPTPCHPSSLPAAFVPPDPLTTALDALVHRAADYASRTSSASTRKAGVR